MNVSLKQGIHSPKDLLSSLHSHLLDRMAICMDAQCAQSDQEFTITATSAVLRLAQRVTESFLGQIGTMRSRCTRNLA